VQRIFLAALVGTAPHLDVIKAGCNLLDFIYLAQYQSHTDCTLVVLQQALDSFHMVKDIFIDLGCWEHFNMLKIHSLQHYVETIRSLGSLDGLNTETLERLHINFAKKAYSASNRRDYLVQMTRWLQCQEAIIWFSSYLTWRLGNIQPEPQPADDCDRSNESDVPPEHPDALLNCTMLARPTKSFPTRIHSHPQCDNGPCKPPTPARFDTVLTLFDEELLQCGGFHGLRITEIRIIFKLPGHLGNYPHPLAYIHWFPNAAINPHWTQGHAMTDANVFYLNKYIDFRMFVLEVEVWAGGQVKPEGAQVAAMDDTRTWPEAAFRPQYVKCRTCFVDLGEKLLPVSWQVAQPVKDVFGFEIAGGLELWPFCDVVFQLPSLGFR
ncbi:hypothetical protein EV401DRAFT_1892049, partial [Pisolithus croceorrhizus]